MKKWAFIDCFKEVNFENIDFEAYEKVILFTSRDLLIPIGDVKPELQLGIINSDAVTQQQMTVVVTYHISQFDLKAAPNIQFDIYSDDIELPSLDDCLRKANRHSHLFCLPPSEKITLSRAVDNFVNQIRTAYKNKTHRPRSISVYSYILENDWRHLRGRVRADEILEYLDNTGAIKHASNGIYFRF